MSARKALGKGLSALIPDQGKVMPRVTEISLEEIVTNRYQPRTRFNDETIKGLADSIRENGVIQPVIVHRIQDGYELIAGERRMRACRLLGYKTVPALIKSIQKVEALEIAIVENIQREELNPIEEARAYRMLMDEFGLTQELAAKKVGKERSTVANFLRLLKLPDEIKSDIEDGRLTMGHARALLACETEASMMEMRKQILEYGLNVRDVENKAARKKKLTGKKKAQVQDPFTRDLLERIKRKLQTKVSMKTNSKGGGFIHIEFYTPEDLDRIADILG